VPSKPWKALCCLLPYNHIQKTNLRNFKGQPWRKAIVEGTKYKSLKTLKFVLQENEKTQDSCLYELEYKWQKNQGQVLFWKLLEGQTNKKTPQLSIFYTILRVSQFTFTSICTKD